MSKHEKLHSAHIECVPLTKPAKELVYFMALDGPAILAKDLERVHDLATYFCKLELSASDIESLYITHRLIEEMKKVKDIR